MAESFLTPVIESLVKLLTNEVNLLKGVHKEVESLKRELEIIQSFLKDAKTRIDRGDELSEAVKTWMKQLKEEAERVEDIIDEYRHHVAQGTTHKRGFIAFFFRIGHQIKALKSRYPVASHIHSIKESLRTIKDIGQGYGLSQSLALQGSSSDTSIQVHHDPRLVSNFIEEDEYVDVPIIQEELNTSLTTQGVSTRMVISIVGQGGVGKTTLVKKLYDEVKQCFDCHVWITVSQLYDMEKILKIMVKQMCPIADSTTERERDLIQLITLLRQSLLTKRYVVVFDDVWDRDFWEIMKHAFPSNNNLAGRIIITTRNVAIASDCNETPYDLIQEIQTWSQDMSWELFCKKTFQYDQFGSHCPDELRELSHAIVSKCQGLPLTIGAIAGILSRKMKVRYEWERVLNDLNSEFKIDNNHEHTRISKILYLSYSDLPDHLKSCFLYFSIFPQDCSIRFERLCWLWIAEGFVRSWENKTLEEVAEEYLNELIKRNLVLYEELNGLDRLCKVHDLMHEFIQSRANDLCFNQFIDHEKKSMNGGTTRRLSIYGSMNHVMKAIKQSTIQELPIEINKLCNLRHIFARFIDQTKISDVFGAVHGVKMQQGFGCLENLETLRHMKLHPSDDIANVTKEIEKLRKLKSLGVTNLTTPTARAICESTLLKLNQLEHLDLTTAIEHDELVLDIGLHSSSALPFPLLSKLRLVGGLRKFPPWISKLWNLETLYLGFSKLDDDPLEYLKELPNLTTLRLNQAYNGQQLHFEDGFFRKLKELWLSDLKRLKVVKIDKGTLPLLKILDLVSCPLLEEVPSGVQHLKNLKHFTISAMPGEFVAGIMQQNGGIDYPKIHHVPTVRI
ncbi:disease resistance protein RPM1-like [Humulus lupulus]|uniref:disease resistance protein RPM1-like n=1 Tax=Humulus lupulus TaxID=3486 RepID=UPI002B411C39|nr:disease resistance protein RPM1-like [Humulus lupulus]